MELRFFVFGAPKSGTTWLQRILDAHPSVSCSGEGHFIENIATPMHAALLAYRDRMRTVSNLVYDDQPSYPALTDRDIDCLIKQSIESLLARSPGAASSRWIGDKTPAYALQLSGLNLLYPDAKLFHIVRDPRDVAASVLNFAARYRQIDRENDREARKLIIDAAIERWRQTITAVNAHSKASRGRLLEVRYEDLKFDFSNTFNRLIGHLGLKASPALTEEIQSATSFQTLSGGRRPGERAPGSFFYSGTVGRYADDLSPFEIDRIQDQLESWMGSFGYESFQSLKTACGATGRPSERRA